MPAQVLSVVASSSPTSRSTLHTVSRAEPPPAAESVGDAVAAELTCRVRRRGQWAAWPAKGSASAVKSCRPTVRARPFMFSAVVCGEEMSSQAVNSLTGRTLPGRTT